MIRSDRQYLRKRGPERVILFGSKSFHVYVCFADSRFCDAMFLVKKKKCAGHTYYSAVSPPSEFYNITIDGNKVKCLICSIAVGRLDSKIDSIVLDIERIRLVRIEPRNLTAICTAKETNHSHEMLVSSAYCDTVYKTYTKPEFYSVSRYQTLKQPCPLLPDRILGFNFISSLSRSFRYIRVHRFRHPSSLRGVYNPLSIAHLHVPLNTSASDASNVLSDSSSLSTDSSQPISVSSTTSSSTVISQADALTASDSRFELNRNLNSVASLHGTFSTEDHIRPYNFQQGFFSVYHNYDSAAPSSYNERKYGSQETQMEASNNYATPTENTCSALASRGLTTFSDYDFGFRTRYSDDNIDANHSNQIKDETAMATTSSGQCHYNGCEVPNDFDMIHFE